ncbi:hypothetical protein HA402_007757 [Bradysia odoriphaga]|nr:hypothetical protein HA402_007757 [Bradysia odoriphaga]
MDTHRRSQEPLESSLQLIEDMDVDDPDNRIIDGRNRKRILHEIQLSWDSSTYNLISSCESGVDMPSLNSLEDENSCALSDVEHVSHSTLRPTNKHISSSESGVDMPSLNSLEDENGCALSDVEHVLHSTPRPNRSIKLKNPPNIIKIDLDKVDRAIDSVGCPKNNEDRITFIIGAANRITAVDQSDPYPDSDATTDDEIEKKIYTSHPYHGYSNSKFELKFYHKYSTSTDDETGLQQEILRKVRFLHRKDPEEIYALPSGAGQIWLTKWADTNFPLSIASAILKEKSVTAKEVKDLYGNHYLTKFKMRYGESLTDSSDFHLKFAPLIYTKFHANINDANTELKKILGFYQKSTVKVKVQGESIMFPGSVIDMNRYAEVCAKLTSIHNDPDIPRSRKFEGFLSKVPKNRKVQLDNMFQQELHTFFRLRAGSKSDEAMDKLKDFSIVQSCNKKYFQAKHFYILFNRKVVQIFSKRPQLNDLRDIVNSKIFAKDLDNFKKGLESIEISVPAKQTGEKHAKEKLINCLEGVFYDDDMERNYWRVKGEWYQVTGKYSLDIYSEYIRILKTCLLDKVDCSLKELWPKIEVKSKIEFIFEGDYCKLYDNAPNFIVCDSNDLKGVEICDLVEFITIGKSTMRLHFVKKAFGADGYRVAFFQILCAVRYLYDSIQKGDRSNDSAAFKLFTIINKNKKASTPQFATYKLFLDELQSATIVFSPLFESGNRKLDNDYMALLKYDFSDIEEHVDNGYRDGLETELKNFLVDSGYIYQSDGVFTEKWFDACAVINDRGFHVKNDRGHYFDPFPGKGISNMKPDKLRKILKKKYYKTVDGLSVKQAFVHCAEVLKAH